MPKHQIPTLGAVATAKTDEKRQKKAAGLFASLAALLGFSADAVPAAGKMRKVTEKHTHTKLEEESGGSESEAEEEEGSTGGSTGSESTGTDSSMSSTGGSTGTGSDAEEEEGGGKMEEEEEASAKGLGRALRAAYGSPAVRDAFLAALPEKHRAMGSLCAPYRLLREARKATGANGVHGTMTALSQHRANTATGAAKVIKATAGLAAKVTKIEASQRAERVEALVATAKAEGRATSKDLRAQLRAYGAANGTKALKALVATLPKVAGGTERIPRTDATGNPQGVPGADQQAREMAIADLNPAERAEYEKIRATVAASRANGAPPRGY